MLLLKLLLSGALTCKTRVEKSQLDESVVHLIVSLTEKRNVYIFIRENLIKETKIKPSVLAEVLPM